MINELIGNLGFFNKPRIKIASNSYMPEGLVERVRYSTNLASIGNNSSFNLTGGGISFDEKQAEIAAIGEYVERYSSSFQNKDGLIFGSYNELTKRYKCFNPDDLKYFSKEQYDTPGFEFNRFEKTTKVHWIESCDYETGSPVLLPFFMTNIENIDGDGMFHVNTSTGTAAQVNINKAIESGLLECIERDAFSKFWLKQDLTGKLSLDFILNKFSGNDKIQKLFNNEQVRISIYDIGNQALLPTFVVFLYFKKNNKIYQSVGSATRENKLEALIKAGIEAYQGIEYVEMVYQQNKNEISEELINRDDFSEIKTFKHHFALYNVYPELRNRVPLIIDAQKYNTGKDLWIDHEHHLNGIATEDIDFSKTGPIYYSVLTTVDVRQLGFEVVKVTTPKLNLLTGNHNFIYLGLYKDSNNLFTKYPHPFP